jgi:hypothetical protein
MSGGSSGESLEAILASIRRSLTEQATTALDEAAASAEVPAFEAPPESPDAPADLDAPPVPASVSRQLAAALDAVQVTSMGATTDPAEDAAMSAAISPPGPVLKLVSSAPAPGAAGAPPADVAAAAPFASASTPAAEQDLGPADATGQPLDEAPPVPSALSEPREQGAPPAPVSPAGETASGPASVLQAGQEDPLWFLGQGAVGTAQAREPKPVPVPEPKPSPLVSGRGPLAPFFGSSAAGVVKVEMVQDRSVRAGASAPLPLAPAQVLPITTHPADSMHASGEAARGVHVPQAGDTRDGLRAASSVFDPPPTDGAPAATVDASSPQIQALEAMVAELLRPMLRRWLDENMPRLVSAALQAELMARRDPKKP